MMRPIIRCARKPRRMRLRQPRSAHAPKHPRGTSGASPLDHAAPRHLKAVETKRTGETTEKDAPTKRRQQREHRRPRRSNPRASTAGAGGERPEEKSKRRRRGGAIHSMQLNVPAYSHRGACGFGARQPVRRMHLLKHRTPGAIQKNQARSWARSGPAMKVARLRRNIPMLWAEGPLSGATGAMGTPASHRPRLPTYGAALWHERPLQGREQRSAHTDPTLPWEAGLTTAKAPGRAAERAAGGGGGGAATHASGEGSGRASTPGARPDARARHSVPGAPLA